MKPRSCFDDSAGFQIARDRAGVWNDERGWRRKVKSLNLWRMLRGPQEGGRLSMRR
jgi:hypothetical protein